MKPKPQLLKFDLSIVSNLGYHTEFTEALKLATKAVGEGYIEFQVYGQESTSRERVYCYELYHQLRCKWGKMGMYRLNGEVDKIGHRHLKKAGLSPIKPDFIVHMPGNEDGHTVIEVKRKTAKANEIIKDLRSLYDFIFKAKYQRAIFLVYGNDADREVHSELTKALGMLKHTKLPNENAAPIEIWFHKTDGQPADPTCVIWLSQESFQSRPEKKKPRRFLQ